MNTGAASPPLMPSRSIADECPQRVEAGRLELPPTLPGEMEFACGAKRKLRCRGSVVSCSIGPSALLRQMSSQRDSQHSSVRGWTPVARRIAG